MMLELKAVAIAMVRISLGILLFFQAYDRIFNIGLKQVAQTIASGSQVSKLPKNFVVFSTHSSSYIELVGGILLVIGVFLPYVYLALAFNMVMVVLAFSFIEPVWNMNHVFPRMAMLVFLMISPVAADIYRVGWFF